MVRERNRNNGDDMDREEPVIVVPGLNSMRIGSEESQVAGGMGEERFGDVVRTVDTTNGLERRTVSVGPYFCSCGSQLRPDNVSRCSHCQRMICSSCIIEYETRPHCESCFRAFHHNLNKRKYVVLMCVANKVSNESDIKSLTGIPANEVRILINSLPEYITVAYVFFGLFRGEAQISMIGREALYAYDKIYGKENDVMRFKEYLRGFIYQKMADESNPGGIEKTIENIFRR